MGRSLRGECALTAPALELTNKCCHREEDAGHRRSDLTPTPGREPFPSVGMTSASERGLRQRSNSRPLPSIPVANWLIKYKVGAERLELTTSRIINQVNAGTI